MKFPYMMHVVSIRPSYIPFYMLPVQFSGESRSYTNLNLSTKDLFIRSFRLSRWRDVARISVEWNAACYKEEYISSLFQEVVAIMNVFAD